MTEVNLDGYVAACNDIRDRVRDKRTDIRTIDSDRTCRRRRGGARSAMRARCSATESLPATLMASWQ